MTDEERIVVILEQGYESMIKSLNELEIKDRNFAIVVWSDKDHSERMQLGSNASPESLRSVTESLIVQLHEEYEGEIH